MQMLRLSLPIVLALFALTGAATTALGAGQPVDAALTPAAGPAQEADDADGEATAGANGGDVDVRPDRSDARHRIAALCYRLHHSDREAPELRARCAGIFGDERPDPAALCRQLIDRGADEHAVRRCIDRATDGVDAGQICRRAHDADPSRDVARILERCRAHLGDATDRDPAQICRRALSGDLAGDRGSDLLARCRDHFGDAVSDRPGDVCGKAIDSDSNRDVASIIARCRDYVGHDRAPGRFDRPNVDQIRDALTDRLHNADGKTADAIRARLAQLDGSDRGELLHKRNQRTDRPQRVPSFRVPGEALPAQVQ